MNTDKTYTSAVAAAKDFFGAPVADPTATGFMAEWKKLNAEDQAEIKAGLIQNGYKIEPPHLAKSA